MQERNFLLRFFSVSPGHKIIALVLAAGIAAGTHSWLKSHADQSPSAAQLSFDSDAALQINPSLAETPQPAVALAQSILNNDAVDSLRQSANSPSAPDIDAGEFRSRLSLTQPSAQSLSIRFQDDDNPAIAARAANAVAKTLAAWTPPAATTPAAAPAPTPKPVHLAAPAHPEHARPAHARPAPARQEPAQPDASQNESQDQPSPALAASLATIQQQLSATNRELEALGSAGAGRSPGYARGYEGSSYTESQQQQLLKSRVRAAQSQIENLRRQYANNHENAGTRSDIPDRLTTIQHELSAVLNGGGAYGFNTAGISASRLRQERSRLVEAIGIVDKQRQAIQHEEGARPARNVPRNLPTQSPAVVEYQAPAAQPQQPRAAAPPAAASTTPAPAAQNPFKVTALATLPAAPLWWPGIAAGLLCALLYMGWATLQEGAPAEDLSEPTESFAESQSFGNHFITPASPHSVPVAEPILAPAAVSAAEPIPASVPARIPDAVPQPIAARAIAGMAPPAEPVAGPPVPGPTASPVELKNTEIQNTATRPPSRRTFFDPEPFVKPPESDAQRPPSRRASFIFEPASTHSPFADNAPSSEPAVPIDSQNGQARSAANPSAANTSAENNGVEVPELAVSEPAVPDSPVPDPWAEQIRKALSQTEFGRRYEDAPNLHDRAATGQESATSQADVPRVNRRAG